MPKNSRKSLIIIIVLIAVAVVVVLAFFATSDSTQEPTVKDRLSIDTVQQVKDNTEGPEDTFSLLTATASTLFESGDPDGAEEYYVEALNFAKSTDDRSMQNAGHRLLLAYYQLVGRDADFDMLVLEVGEERMKEVFAPDPRDIEFDG